MAPVSGATTALQPFKMEAWGGNLRWHSETSGSYLEDFTGRLQDKGSSSGALRLKLTGLLPCIKETNANQKKQIVSFFKIKSHMWLFTDSSCQRSNYRQGVTLDIKLMHLYLPSIICRLCLSLLETFVHLTGLKREGTWALVWLEGRETANKEVISGKPIY